MTPVCFDMGVEVKIKTQTKIERRVKTAKEDNFYLINFTSWRQFFFLTGRDLERKGHMPCFFLDEVLGYRYIDDISLDRV